MYNIRIDGRSIRVEIYLVRKNSKIYSCQLTSLIEMICVECTNPDIDCLYFRYKSEYIKLTICSKCGRVADKYIEFDNVILFLDIMLLKPQAYRHLTYNITESELLKDEATHKGYVKHNTSHSIVFSLKRSILRYRALIRFVTVMILFEVYLTYAYEERKDKHSIIMAFILDQEIHYQYLFFILKLILEEATLNFSIQYFSHKFFRWGSIESKNINEQFQNGYRRYVLLVSVLVSSSIKLFPILMLIWPYDRTTISTTIINVIGFLNTTEALKLVTNMNYISITVILGISTALKNLISRSILGVLVSYMSNSTISQIQTSEYNETIDLLRNSIDFLRSLKDSLIN